MDDVCPTSSCTLTVRLIRSFTYRNIKHLVLKDVDLKMTAAEFIAFATEEMKKKNDIPPPFKTFKYDSIKIEHKAHGFKTSDPVINTEDDDQLMISPATSLVQAGVENETELSMFRLSDYQEYQKNPQVSW